MGGISASQISAACIHKSEDKWRKNRMMRQNQNTINLSKAFASNSNKEVYIPLAHHNFGDS